MKNWIYMEKNIDNKLDMKNVNDPEIEKDIFIEYVYQRWSNSEEFQEIQKNNNQYLENLKELSENPKNILSEEEQEEFYTFRY